MASARSTSARQRTTRAGCRCARLVARTLLNSRLISWAAADGSPDRECRDDEHAGRGDTRRLGLVNGLVAPYVHQPVCTESDGVEGVLQCAHVHAGGQTLGMGRLDQRADRIAAERREVPAECAPVSPHDLDPV